MMYIIDKEGRPARLFDRTLMLDGDQHVIVLPEADWRELVEAWADIEAWRTGDTLKGVAAGDGIVKIHAIIQRTEQSNA